MSTHEITDKLKLPAEKNSKNTFFAVGIVALIASVVGFFFDHRQFLFSYLTSFTFFSSIAITALFFVMLQHLTRSYWSVAIRRIPESISANIWIWALFILPIIFGMHYLYEWSHAEIVANDPVLQGKSGYLNPTFYIIRQVIYFAIWSFLGWRMYSNSVKMDETNDWGLQTLMRRTSGPGIFLFTITCAFAAFDWIMSLDPHWYSTIFGVYFFAMAFQSLFAVLILAVIFTWRRGLLKNTWDRTNLYDLGVQLFGFTIFYAYIAFAQFLLIYYGNLPEETTWFLERLSGGYQYLAYFYLFGRFVIPFFVLLPKKTKSIPAVVGSVAGLILLSHLVELYWIVMPVLHEHGFYLSWMTITCFIGLGSICVGLFFHRFGQASMIPINDPRLKESLHQH